MIYPRFLNGIFPLVKMRKRKICVYDYVLIVKCYQYMIICECDVYQCMLIS